MGFVKNDILFSQFKKHEMVTKVSVHENQTVKRNQIIEKPSISWKQYLYRL